MTDVLVAIIVGSLIGLVIGDFSQLWPTRGAQLADRIDSHGSSPVAVP